MISYWLKFYYILLLALSGKDELTGYQLLCTVNICCKVEFVTEAEDIILCTHCILNSCLYQAITPLGFKDAALG